jgi:hypothetical protein
MVLYPQSTILWGFRPLLPLFCGVQLRVRGYHGPYTALFSLVQCRISALVAAITTLSTALGQFANGG